MEIVEIAKDRLKVVLDAKELQEFAIDLDGMEYADANTEQMLEGILAVVRAKTDFGLEKGKTYVQFYPSRAGGCELFLIHISEKDRKKSRALVPFRAENGYLCCFEGKKEARFFENLLFAFGEAQRCVFYDAEGDRYLFYVYGVKEQALLLEEFGQPADRGVCRYLCEHFQKAEEL